jgi:hypothetical protein
MVTITKNGVTLSASACLNGWPEPALTTISSFAGRGDFASRLGGRIRRMERRNRLQVKHAGYEG